MTISFIGAGKVGRSLSLYFKQNNLSVLGFYSLALGNLSQALEADIIMITVNDDAILEVAHDLARLGIDYKHKLFVHTSGAHSSALLEVLQNETSGLASMHPIQAFSDIPDAVIQLRQTVFSLEGDANSVTRLGNILSQCGNRHFILSKEQKPLYHASACVVSNYLVTLLSYGFSMLDHIGLPKDLALESFFPLIESTLSNIKAHGPEDALTGPIARGDFQTISRHLVAFKINEFDDTDLYKLLGLYTANLAKQKLVKEDSNEKEYG